MSTRATYATKLSDKDCLVDALKELCGPSYVSVNSEEIVGDYNGKAFTFSKSNKSDTYSVTVNNDGNRRILQGTILPDTVNGQTIYKLGQIYSKAMVMKAMRSLKGTVVKDDVDEDGISQIKIRITTFDE